MTNVKLMRIETINCFHWNTSLDNLDFKSTNRFYSLLCLIFTSHREWFSSALGVTAERRAGAERKWNNTFAKSTWGRFFRERRALGR